VKRLVYSESQLINVWFRRNHQSIRKKKLELRLEVTSSLKRMLVVRRWIKIKKVVIIDHQVSLILFQIKVNHRINRIIMIVRVSISMNR